MSFVSVDLPDYLHLPLNFFVLSLAADIHIAFVIVVAIRYIL